MYQYAYTIGDLFFIFIWVILYTHRKDLRREMIAMSLLTMPLGISDVLYYQDYWRPKFILDLGLHFGLESFIFSFMVGGITSVVCEEVFGKKYALRHAGRKPIFPTQIFAICTALLLFGTIALKINSIYVSSTLMFACGMYVIYRRHYLIKESVLSGFLLVILFFVFYKFYFLLIYPGIIQKWWLLQNISGVFVFGIPIEELMWAFCFGFVAGPIYEFAIRLKI